MKNNTSYVITITSSAWNQGVLPLNIDLKKFHTYRGLGLRNPENPRTVSNDGTQAGPWRTEMSNSTLQLLNHNALTK